MPSLDRRDDKKQLVAVDAASTIISAGPRDGGPSQVQHSQITDTACTHRESWHPFVHDTMLEDLPVIHKPQPGNIESAIHDLLNDDQPSRQLFGHDGSPFALIRHSIVDQVDLTSAAILNHLFLTCDLAGNLDLLYRFYLCGDADFVDRLRLAIFGPLEQSGKTLDLNNLDTVQWPPRTSKLSMNLLSILGETTTVSFTVRQLSESDMEQACDAASIHALDFLQLKIERPSALDFLANEGYDQIFVALLLHTRMLHLTTRLRRLSRSLQSPRVVHRMHHATSTFASHFTQLAIDSAWRKFTKNSRAARSLEELTELHKDCLQQIRSRLFLRKRQTKVKIAIEALYSHILLFAKLEPDSDSDQTARLVEDVVMNLIEYATSIRSVVASDEEEVELVRILTSRLEQSREHSRSP